MTCFYWWSKRWTFFSCISFLCYPEICPLLSMHFLQPCYLNFGLKVPLHWTKN